MLTYSSHHVLKDLTPYVCIEENCNASSMQFTEIETWIQHMCEHHPVWTCKATVHGPKVFHSSIGFQDHMQAEHDNSFNEVQLAELVAKNSQPGPSPFSVEVMGRFDQKNSLCIFCPFSFSEAEKKRTQFSVRNGRKRPTELDLEKIVQNHVAEHLELIALWALPANENSECAGSSKVSARGSDWKSVNLSILNLTLDMEGSKSYQRPHVPSKSVGTGSHRMNLDDVILTFDQDREDSEQGGSTLSTTDEYTWTSINAWKLQNQKLPELSVDPVLDSFRRRHHSYIKASSTFMAPYKRNMRFKDPSRLLRAVRTALDRQRLVTLTGLGGIG